MAAFAFNVAKGRIVEFFLSSSDGIVVLLEAAEVDAVLQDYDTLADLLAAAGNTEATDGSYARRTGVGATVIVDDVNDRVDVDVDDQTFTGLSGNPIVKAIVAFEEGPSDAQRIPFTGHDWVFTPDGSDATIRFP